ncbi:BCCT family transporter [Celeribacter halophilus]|jgi:choline-glycine betaine transporter|uniref:Choline-glycine betaine transporter n=1 Tax=Celeribacter halophilus TaxID=576117 RepID=A0A1I3WFS2_9RHOB|nr:BCCT family transporter [Celeribacter halophilus]MBU2888168.1 BCCT family transporter [Celeribacter halophilus]MDO6512135.1 BCCT family transporter [Celeribacter halophilus]PZX06792.1 choline-glycine betaine transporter [Celeribacter halophilus]SFK06019.1 Choline-glycine betaine transporter [Celeribacter halophilus]
MTETSQTNTTQGKRINIPVFVISGGFIALFCLAALINLDALSRAVDWSFNIAATYFGLYWQFLLLATFLIGLLLCVLPGGRAIMGNIAKPEFTTFQWGSMIMCTLLAGGGVFWAAGEPIAHFLSSPPLFGAESGTPEAVTPAIAQSFMHWGFLAWAILGSLTTIMLMHYHYEKGLPLAPRTLLYPVFGDKAIHGPIGIIADAASIIAVVAGTVGPIGFLGLQVSYGLAELFGIPNVFATQFAVIGGLVAIYTISAMTGLSRGIQFLSKLNVILASVLLVFVLLAGPTGFIFSTFFTGFTSYIAHFFDMALYRGDAGVFGAPGWLGWWTVFFWGWFMGYGPLMAMFIARVSRGRSIRSIIIMLSIIAPIVTNFWFTIVGGTGIAMELAEPGVVSSAFEGFNLPAALLAITSNLPMGFLVSLLFLILTTIFVATTGDSMSYMIASVMSRDETPSVPVRVFWGIAMGVMAIILISVGSGGVSKLQSFIVVTAVPVSLLLLPSLWDALRITLAKGKKD